MLYTGLLNPTVPHIPHYSKPEIEIVQYFYKAHQLTGHTLIPLIIFNPPEARLHIYSFEKKAVWAMLLHADLKQNKYRIYKSVGNCAYNYWVIWGFDQNIYTIYIQWPIYNNISAIAHFNLPNENKKWEKILAVKQILYIYMQFLFLIA